MGGTDDRRVDFKAPAHTELTEELKAKVEAIAEEFDKLVSARDGDAALLLVQRTVGLDKVHIASAHLAGLRSAKLRQAAKAKGFNVGI